MRALARFTTVCLFLLLAACSDPESPEARVRAILAEAEAAAEERDIGFFRNLIAEDYSDKRGRNRSEIIQQAWFYFQRNQFIQVLSRIESIEFPVPELTRVELVAGLAGRDEQAASVWELQADVYRFELEMRLDGDGEWKLIHAGWRRGP